MRGGQTSLCRPLVASEIGVRDYVSETPGDKHFTHRGTLRMAVLE